MKKHKLQKNAYKRMKTADKLRRKKERVTEG